MKYREILFGAVLASCLLGSCASKPVARISAERQRDLSGNWNDNDIRIVCESIIDECVRSPQIKRFAQRNGRFPYVKLGTIMNLSDEFIDTTIISAKFRNAIISSGGLNFVASDSEVVTLRNEQLSQADHAALGTEAQLGNETAADFMLQGTIKTVIDQNSTTVQKTYYVDVQMYDVGTTEVVWTVENADIVKVLNKKRLRF